MTLWWEGETLALPGRKNAKAQLGSRETYQQAVVEMLMTGFQRL